MLLIIHECTYVCLLFYSFSSQNDPTTDEKFNQSSYFVRALAYAIGHGWTFDETTINEMMTKVIKQSTSTTPVYFCRVFGDCEALYVLLKENYVKNISGFFELRPEDLDTTPEYFCEVFGFCDF